MREAILVDQVTNWGLGTTSLEESFSERSAVNEPPQSPNEPPGREYSDEQPIVLEQALEPEYLLPFGRATNRGTFVSAETSREGPREPVDCTVFAPTQTGPGRSILVQVFAHGPEQDAEVRAEAREFDPDASRRGRTSLATEIAVGSQLTLRLSLPGLGVDEPVQYLIWRSRPASVQFEVHVPDSARLGDVIGTVAIDQDGVPIGEIRFKLTIAERAGLDHRPAPTGEARRYQMAFTSYAAEDRPEVLRRVQMLPRVGIEFFHDLLYLDPARLTEQELYRRIDDCDVFFLFWSSAARRSPDVTQEWRYGLANKGLAGC